MYKAKTLLLLFALVLISGMQVECRRKPDISDPAVAKMVLDKCAERMQVKFPPSTRLLNFAEGTGQDYTAYLKVEIDEKDLEFFIQNSAFACKELRTDRTYMDLSSGKKWWTAGNNSKTYKSGFTRLPGRYDEPIAILIDLDKQGKSVIYLQYMGRPIIFQGE